jgi:hypothetical protein
MVLRVVIDAAVDKPGAAWVPLLAVALVEGGSKKMATRVSRVNVPGQ